MLIVSIPINSLAEDAVVLDKDQKAPYRGLLLPQDKANELYNYKLINESLTTSIKLYKENEVYQQNKVNILLEQNDKLAKSVTESRNTSDWEKVLWFTLGIVGTGLGVYVAKKVAQ